MKFIKVLMISAAFAAVFAKNCVRPTKPCYIGGCSNEICSAEQGVASPCIWTPEFACYQDATCERQANGKCGWTQTGALEQCIEAAQNEEEGVESPCYVGGCSNEICSAEENAASICIWSPEFACYKDAVCERQADGQCGWTETKALKKCLANPPAEDPADGLCYVGGCSGEICSDEEGASSTCIWSPEFACYKDATCERQASGKCGWTETKALEKCLANAADE